MKHLIVTLSLALALIGCKKDPAADKVGDKPVADDKPVVPPAAPDASAPPADPTASWTEQPGTGFVVTAPRAPNIQQQTVPSALGDQPITMYVGYEPPGFKGAFQTAVSDASAVVKDLTALDGKQMVDDGVKGAIANLPGTTIEKDEALPDDHGRAIVATGNHPQGGPFKLVLRIFFRAGKLYMVQALYVDAADAPLATKFVESFKITG